MHKMINKNDEFELKIDGFTSEGSGVGKKDGMAVFVENTAAGDIVKCHIIKAKKTYAIGKAVSVIKPSPDRIKPECDCSASCGGCSYSHISYEAELKLKEEKVRDAFLRIAHLSPKINAITSSPEISHYRNKAQYPISRENGTLKIGFYAKKSHRVIDAEGCLLQPAEFSLITDIFKNWINRNSVTVYSEELCKGLMRHIYIRKAFATGEIMVTAIINGNTLPASDELISELKCVAGFKTFVVNINRENSNVVLGNKCVTLYGEGYITDVLCGIKVKLSPLSFYQVNHDAAELLYSKAREYAALKESDTLLDLYCGTGTIGLTMAKNVKSLKGVEIIPEAIEDAKVNAELNGFNNTEFICADASAAAEELSSRGITPEVIILDPPRKGCDSLLLNTVAKMNPQRIVYVSCDPATLARDCERLSSLGYTVKEASPFDMFPRTFHVETVALIAKTEE